MKKRFLAIFLALVMVLAMLPTAAAAPGENGFDIEDGVLIKYSGDGGDVTIPDGVTSIGDDAFEGCAGLTSVTIPGSVTSIGKYAFYGCENLTSVTFQGDCPTIGATTFSSMTNLEKIRYPNGATGFTGTDFGVGTSVLLAAYGDPALTAPTGTLDPDEDGNFSVTITSQIPFDPTNGRDTNNYTVTGGNFALESVDLSNEDKTATLTLAVSDTQAASARAALTITVKPEAFIAGVALEDADGTPVGDLAVSVSVNVPDPVDPDVLDSGVCGAQGENVRWTLYRDRRLIISGTGAMADYSDAARAPWYGNSASINTVIIENGVTSIGDEAFELCTGLTSVTIPGSVTSIGICAFSGTGLTSVIIPGGVTSIGDAAFQYCSYLESVIIPGSVTSIGGGAFVNCYSLTSVVIPAGVTSIGDEAFELCTGLTSVTIPGSVTSIGICAFSGTGLTSVSIPGSVTSIGVAAFQYCYNLESVIIPGSVTSIGVGAFVNCYSLTSVVIPAGVTSIGDETFEGCTRLTSVTIPTSVTSIGYGAFDQCTSLADVYYGGTEGDWAGISISVRNDPLNNANIHYNGSRPVTPPEPPVSPYPDPGPVIIPPVTPGTPAATPTRPADPPKIPDLIPSPIQNEIIRTDREEMPDWVDRLVLPDYAQTFYDVMSGNTAAGKTQSVFEAEQNFALRADDGEGVEAPVDEIEVVEFDFTDMYAGGESTVQSSIFEDESFYRIPVDDGSRSIDYANLTTGSVVRTSSFNGIYVTSIPRDDAFDSKRKETSGYVAAVYQAFDRDNPEVFWLSGKCKTRIMTVTDPATGGKEAYFFLVLADEDGFTMCSPDWTAAGSIASGIARRDAAAEEILQTVTAGDTAGKIRQLNKYLTEHNQYNTTPDLTTIGNEPHECLAALEGRIGREGPVCDGYSRAFKVLCDRLGIPCVLETGWAKSQANSTPQFHMWNLAQVSGTWYGADITWDDPTVKDIVAAISGRENENYLLIGSDTVAGSLPFSQSHVVQDQAAAGGVDFNNGPILSPIAYSGLSAPSFLDVRDGDYYHDSVWWAIDRGITAGTSQTAFSPDQDCTEIQILTFLWREAGRPAADVTLPFSMTGADDYVSAAKWACAQGMIDASFEQDTPCTRANAVKFMWQAAGSPAVSGGGFTDVPAGAAYAQAVAWALAKGVTNGAGIDTFGPDQTCTRAQIVTFLYRGRT